MKTSVVCQLNACADSAVVGPGGGAHGVGLLYCGVAVVIEVDTQGVMNMVERGRRSGGAGVRRFPRSLSVALDRRCAQYEAAFKSSALGVRAMRCIKLCLTVLLLHLLADCSVPKAKMRHTSAEGNWHRHPLCEQTMRQVSITTSAHRTTDVWYH